ncbi:unnamed protein product [Acanthoscelides obtectus]|uniref:Uncharacterized protein n=1 Tax=Acanthoscelides obtectus TaxID=200917 RepID=A0A9P0JLP0_ACAOB|nr:unnamed protein product [Acanthoscelides obtectus]CAK1672360.1 hypothetical protein AOBTE_LOCUS28819 [Acanthoscelides obtectus]
MKKMRMCWVAVNKTAVLDDNIVRYVPWRRTMDIKCEDNNGLLHQGFLTIYLTSENGA